MVDPVVRGNVGACPHGLSVVVVLGRASFTVVDGGSDDGHLGASIVEVVRRDDAYDNGESSIALRKADVGDLGLAVPVIGGAPGLYDRVTCTLGTSTVQVNGGRNGRRRRCRADRRSRRRSGCRLVWKIRAGICRGRTGKPWGRGHGRRGGRRGRRRGRGDASKGGREGRAETWRPAAAVGAKGTEGAQEPINGAALRAHRLRPPLRRSLGPAQRPCEGTLRPPGQTVAVAKVDPIVSVGCSPGCSSEAYSSTSSFGRRSSEGSWSSENGSSENCSSNVPCFSLAVRVNSLIRRWLPHHRLVGVSSLIRS